MSKVTVSVVLTTVGYTSRFNGKGRTTVRPYSRYTSSGGTRIASEMSEKLEGV